MPAADGGLDLVGPPAEDRELRRRRGLPAVVPHLTRSLLEDRGEQGRQTGSAAMARGGGRRGRASSLATRSRRSWLSTLLGTIGRPTIVASRVAQPVDRASQPAELLAEQRLVGRLRIEPARAESRVSTAAADGRSPSWPSTSSGRPDLGTDLEVEVDQPARRPLERSGAGGAVSSGSSVFQTPWPRLDPPQVEGVAAEPELDAGRTGDRR